MKRMGSYLSERRAAAWFVKNAIRMSVLTFCLVGAVLMQLRSQGDMSWHAKVYMRVSQWSRPLADLLIGNPLPLGAGLNRQIVVVASKAHQKVLKPVLSDLLLKPVLMPMPEVVFDIVYALPEDFGQYRTYRNLILVASLDDPGILYRSMAPVVSGLAEPVVVIQHDVWASNQMVVAIVAEDAQGVADQAALSGDRIMAEMDASVDRWLTAILYHAGEDVTCSNDLAQRFGWRIRVPVAYKVMDDYADQNFVALVRRIERQQLWVWVYWEDGVHPDDLTADWCLKKRDEIGHRFYAGEQTAFGDVDIYGVEFDGRLAVCLEGLWENKKAWRGGPFKSYALYDTKQDRFFMINAGIYAPNRRKAFQLRLLDILVHTFSIVPFNSMAE